MEAVIPRGKTEKGQSRHFSKMEEGWHGSSRVGYIFRKKIRRNLVFGRGAKSPGAEGENNTP